MFILYEGIDTPVTVFLENKLKLTFLVRLIDISFSIKDKEKVLILGESGIGKSTLLNLIGSIEKPDSGEIIINDNLEWECPNCHNKDKNKMNVTRRTCGYLGENFWIVGKTKEIKARVLHL